MSISFALVGNPNCGKTSLFNSLTGSNQYVGNWPGVTVEKKEGWANVEGSDHVQIIDLPGLYSLTPYSQEEIVTRKYILKDHPSAVICVVDGTNIERNLYLALQVMELGCPVIVAINMLDVLVAQGINIEIDKLSRFLGVECVAVSAKTGEGVELLMKKAIALAKRGDAPNTHGLYDKLTEDTEDRIQTYILPHAMAAHIPERWAALKLLESDEAVREELKLHVEDEAVIDKILDEFVQNSDLKDIDMILPEQRYRFIVRVVEECVRKSQNKKLSPSEKIDLVMTNRFVAIPIFLALMFIMFATTFGPIGNFLVAIMEEFCQMAINLVGMGLAYLKAPEWFFGLIIDGALTGVSGVLEFLPQIAILFFMLALLEDSGYIARVAFIMDRAMRRLGLSGKSFIPMLMGFGCTTPAIMAARTMENTNNRRMTIMLTPFMSCGAKIPVYALFAGAFFAANKTAVIFAMYLIGIAVAIVCGIFLRAYVFKGEQAPFVMELPQYRMPTAKGIGLHVYENVKGFAVRAGTLIFAMSVIIWFLQYFNLSMQPVQNSADSILGTIGKLIAPIFAPIGFGEWRASVSLLSGFAAKEAVVSTAYVLYGGSMTQLQQAFTPLSAFCYMVYVLLSLPCISALAATKREMQSTKWTIGALAFQTVIAYVLCFFIYQIGTLIITGTAAHALWFGSGVLIALLAVLIVNKTIKKDCAHGCSACSKRGICSKH